MDSGFFSGVLVELQQLNKLLIVLTRIAKGTRGYFSYVYIVI